MIFIAMDGASRRPGTPDCLAVGAIYVKGKEFKYTYEDNSTSQRGELLAMLMALRTGTYACKENDEQEFYLITDSEYVYNALTKEWYVGWQIKNWVNAEGNPIKNQDLWQEAIMLLDVMRSLDVEVHVYHTKGHLVSVGKVTAAKAIENDTLRELVLQKYPEAEAKYADKFTKARQLFVDNHGFAAPPAVHKEIVVCNTIVDLYAGYIADQLK